MFNNRQIFPLDWKAWRLKKVVVLSKRSNTVRSRFLHTYLTTRALSHFPQQLWLLPLTNSFSRPCLPTPGSLSRNFQRGFASVALRTSKSYGWILSATGGCNKHMKRKNEANCNTSPCPSVAANSVVIRMEHTESSSSSSSTSQRRGCSDEDGNERKKLKSKSEIESQTMQDTEDDGKAAGSDGMLANKDGDLGNPEVGKPISRREQILCNRPWEITKRAMKLYSSYGDLSQTIYEFSIASYNVLAQNLLEENSYLYQSCDQQCLNWTFRKKLLFSELKKYSPDILCLQEVNEDHFRDFFQPRLDELGYSGEYKKRTGIRRDGCATFYKRDKFDCQLAYPIEYFMPAVPLLDRDNIALVMLLQPKHLNRALDTALCVANTHLLFNPKRGDVKLAQLMVLFSAIDRLVYKESSSTDVLNYHPVVMCGDFNMEPFSDLYNFVRGGSLVCEGTVIKLLSGQESESSRAPVRFLEPGFLEKTAGITDQCQYVDVAMRRMEAELELNCTAGVASQASVSGESVPMTSGKFLTQGSGHLTHRLGLRSVYEHVRSSASLNEHDYEATTYHGNACSTVDYIFYSSASKRAKKRLNGVSHSGGSHLELMSRLRLLTADDMGKVGHLPNDLNPSDHTMLLAKFSFKL